MGTVQEKNKAGFAHEHIFGLDFSLVIEKDIPAAGLETKYYVNSYLEDPQKKWIYQRSRGSVFWSTVA